MDLKLHFIAFFYLLNNSVPSNVDIIPCAWALSGGNKMLQRLCKLRRDFEIAASDVVVRERGPARDPYGYNPTYDFEPYWEFGDWVFQKIRPEPVFGENGEIVVTSMCGSPCPEDLRMIGRICAVDATYTSRTFENYCAMKNEDCDDSEGWTAAYRGACLDVLLPFVTDADQLADRAKYFINEFYKISPTTTVKTTVAG